ncbi:YbgA family protein [Marinimicrobium sp. ARAG 43.8]|uniref:YbgA family protein n=1 Tax=Marinimicrobium sp. ARAG 43.8 TaxID=3418719 RepID=UPI003CF97E49
METAVQEKIPVGISECLLGEPVRFDGGHKRNRFLTDVMSQYFEYRPVCPEVLIGLGIPRKPIRLVATDNGTRVRGVENEALDVTEALAAEADKALARMPDICGYIFMQNSPSCGAFRMKRYRENGYPQDNDGVGAYAERLMALHPLLPVEEAGRLTDAGLRDNFITRVFAYQDWKQSVAFEPTPARLVDFYSRYKYQVMAHHVPGYQALGRLVAKAGATNIDTLCQTFLETFMEALSHHATRKGNTNTMMHLRGYLSDLLSGSENEELSEVIESYRQGEVPLVVPLTLLKHYLRKVDNPYLQRQTFWAPHPEKLGLRNANVS